MTPALVRQEICPGAVQPLGSENVVAAGKFHGDAGVASLTVYVPGLSLIVVDPPHARLTGELLVMFTVNTVASVAPAQTFVMVSVGIALFVSVHATSLSGMLNEPAVPVSPPACHG